MKISKKKAVTASKISGRRPITASADILEEYQELCDQLTGMGSDDAYRLLNFGEYSDAFGGNASHPVMENGELVGRVDEYWDYDNGVSVVLEYDLESRDPDGWAIYGPIKKAYVKDRNSGVTSSHRIRKTSITAAESYGWEVPDDRAQEAYDFAIESGYWDEASLNADIVNAISTDELAACLAFIFRMNDFQEWDDYLNGEESEESEDEDFDDPDYFPDED